MPCFGHNDLTQVGGNLEISSLCHVFLAHKETISLIHIIQQTENYCDTPLHFRLLMLFPPVLREIYFVSYVIIIFSLLSNSKLKSKVCDE